MKDDDKVCELVRVSDADADEVKPKKGSDEHLNGASPLVFETPNTNGASSSSLLVNDFDLNLSPDEYNMKKSQSPNRGLFLAGDPPNPNLQTSSPSNKKRERTGGPKKAKKQKQEAGLGVPPPTPNWLLNRDKTDNVQFICKKILTVSDVKKGESRLLLPFNQLHTNDFLTSMETSHMMQEEKDDKCKKHAIKTILITEHSEEWDLSLRIYHMKKKKSNIGTWAYVFNGGWNKFIKEHMNRGKSLEANDQIYMWSFRSQGILCFALDVQPPAID